MSCSDDDHLEGWYLDTGATNHMTGCGNVFSAYCADEGITRHFSTPYTPQ
jgi:hypothetical protein